METRDEKRRLNNASRKPSEYLGESWEHFCDASDCVQGAGSGSITSVKCISKGQEWLVVIGAYDGKNEWVLFKSIDDLVQLPYALEKAITSDRWKPSKPYGLDKKGQTE